MLLINCRERSFNRLLSRSYSFTPNVNSDGSPVLDKSEIKLSDYKIQGTTDGFPA
ncbi:MAG: hypothetical protein IPJ79_20805 [Bacteroidetes bacterium]|nr:hypothetical protein [Bacteroidota bacterium]